LNERATANFDSGLEGYGCDRLIGQGESDYENQND